MISPAGSKKIGDKNGKGSSKKDREEGRREKAGKEGRREKDSEESSREKDREEGRCEKDRPQSRRQEDDRKARQEGPGRAEGRLSRLIADNCRKGQRAPPLAFQDLLFSTYQ